MFNRKNFTATLVNNAESFNKLSKIIADQFEDVNTGWAIFWKGKMVKPVRAHNHYFASKESAIKAIDRNCGFAGAVEVYLLKEMYGIVPEKGVRHIQESEVYRSYFRLDLVWADNLVDGKVVSRSYRNEKELTPEELIIREERDSELGKFGSYCSNILKTVFIPQWIELGWLEIKLV